MNKLILICRYAALPARHVPWTKLNKIYTSGPAWGLRITLELK